MASASAKFLALILIAYFVFTTMNGNLERWLKVVGLRASTPANEGE